MEIDEGKLLEVCKDPERSRKAILGLLEIIKRLRQNLATLKADNELMLGHLEGSQKAVNEVLEGLLV